MLPSSLPLGLSIAIERLVSQMEAHSTFLASAIHTWMCRMSPTGEPAAELAHPQMFPILQLPEWVVESLGVSMNGEFHHAVTYSSLCGYYYTRLVDDLMDGHVGVQDEIRLLPAAGFFASEFQFAYQPYFPPQHEFWSYFRRTWMDAADGTAHDFTLQVVRREDFERISSRKFAAVGIPVAATAYLYGCPEEGFRWIAFAHALGKWSQLFDDLLDWHADRERGHATWVLSEGERRKHASESVAQWVAREGYTWGFALLQEWMADLVSQAQALGSSGAQDFLERRESLRQQRAETLEKGFASLAQIATILGRT
jgi:hypothetical protein